MTIEQVVEVAKYLSKATNVHKAGYGYFHEMEKHIHKQLHENKLNFQDLSSIAENILPANIGSN